MLKSYLLEKVVRDYVENAEEVLEHLSLRRLMFGVVKLPDVRVIPHRVQDAAFPFAPFACEFVGLKACDVEVEADWLAISFKSLRIKIRHVEAEVLVHDLTQAASAGFLAAQRQRLLADLETSAALAASTLAYKISGGLDVSVEDTAIHLRLAVPKAPSLKFQLTGLRYCAATEDGSPTTDLDEAIHTTSTLVAYGNLCTVDAVLWEWEAGKQLALRGLNVFLSGKCPAYDGWETPFWGSSSLAVHLHDISTTAPILASAFGDLIQVTTTAAWSDNLRAQCASKDSSVQDEVTHDSEALSAVTSSSSLRTLRRDRSLSNLVLGCAQASRRASRATLKVEHLADADLEALAEESAEEGEEEDTPELASRDSFASALTAGDESIPLRGSRRRTRFETADSCGDGDELNHDEDWVDAVSVWSDLTRGAPKSLTISLDAASLQLAAPEGTLAFDFADLCIKTDQRTELRLQQMASIRQLFPAIGDTFSCVSSTNETREARFGITRASLTLASVLVAFKAPGGVSTEELVRLGRGLSVQHTGPAEPFHCSSTSALLLEVDLAGLVLRDAAREPCTHLAKSLLESVAADPCNAAPATAAGASLPLAINLEATDVTLEAPLAEQLWRVSLPCFRIRNVAFEDVWSQVQRQPAPSLFPPSMRAGGGAVEVVAGLAQELEAEKVERSTLEMKLANVERELLRRRKSSLPLELESLATVERPDVESSWWLLRALRRPCGRRRASTAPDELPNDCGV